MKRTGIFWNSVQSVHSHPDSPDFVGTMEQTINTFLTTRASSSSPLNRLTGDYDHPLEQLLPRKSQIKSKNAGIPLEDQMAYPAES